MVLSQPASPSSVLRGLKRGLSLGPFVPGPPPPKPDDFPVPFSLGWGRGFHPAEGSPPAPCQHRVLWGGFSPCTRSTFRVGSAGVCSLSPDIDECLSASCEGHCVNTEGGFVCECGPGMQLSADRHSCQGERLWEGG